MKKIAVCLLSLMLSTTGFSALADTVDNGVYTGSTNSADFTDSAVNGFTTVQIKNESGEIVYINQQSRGLADVPRFMMKEGTPDGTYTATFGDSEGTTKTIDFTVGEFKINGSDKRLDLDTDAKMSIVYDPILQGTAPDGVTNWDATRYRKGYSLIGDYGKTAAYMLSSDSTVCYGHFEPSIPETGGTNSAVLYAIDLCNIYADRLHLNLYLGTDANLVEGGDQE